MKNYNFLPDWYTTQIKKEKLKKRYITLTFLVIFIFGSIMVHNIIYRKIDSYEKANIDLVNGKIQAYKNTKQIQTGNEKIISNFEGLMFILKDDETIEMEIVDSKIDLTIENENYNYCKETLEKIHKQFFVSNYSIVNNENKYRIDIEVEMK